MVVLSSLISLLIVLSCGLFAFEVNRVEVCRSQLRSATEAAALAAAATLASQDITDPAAAQRQAQLTALTTFEANSVAGTSLVTASLSATGEDTPATSSSSLFVQFLDPNKQDAPVSIGDPNGKIVAVTGAFGLAPMFGNFLGLPVVPLRTTARGGVPDLDVVLCFDVSGSMDDQTPVTMVRRQWTGSAASGHTQYIIAPTRGGAPAGPLAQGRIFDIIGPPPTGTAVQALAPQNISQVAYGMKYPLNFSEDGTAVGLRGRSDSGSPPGNMPPGTSGPGNQYTITDIVVNIDGNTRFQGYTSPDGYAFPDLATLVEAARGNLENSVIFAQSKANTGVPAGVQPMSGYQSKYLTLAAANLHPISESINAAETFFTIMNTNTVGHFGLVCFTDNAGTNSSTIVKQNKVDDSYPQGGTASYPNPLVSLNPATGATNYSTIEGKLPTFTAIGGTNIGDALNTAVKELTTSSRFGSKKAIILFTDGMATSGGPLSSDPSTNARMAAVLAGKAGIPVYAIGLAQNPQIVPLETAILTDQNSSPASGGVCGIAGHGGKFFLVTNSADLRYTFENVARQLVQLVQ